MLGDFITRILILVLGYTYPAFECYKTVEKNKVDIDELRFWCQYWILVALLTSFERVGDIFISWFPLYGEMKVMFFVYLWYPKTKGTGYVYKKLLRPYMAKHETDIDHKIMEMKVRAWDFLLYYFQNFARVGQSTLAQVFQYVVAQSIRLSALANQKAVQQNSNSPAQTETEIEEESEQKSQPRPQAQLEPTAVNRTLSSLRSTERQQSRGKKGPPPTPLPKPGRATTESSRSAEVQTGGEESSLSIADTIGGSPITDASARLRRTKAAA